MIYGRTVDVVIAADTGAFEAAMAEAMHKIDEGMYRFSYANAMRGELNMQVRLTESQAVAIARVFGIPTHLLYPPETDR